MDEERIIYWENTRPFICDDNIPEVPIVSKEDYDNVIIPQLIRCGAIPKNELIVGDTYVGSCRNASKAIWDGNKFTYKRYKFGSYYDDEVNHFQDDDGYDVFVPILHKTEEKYRWEIELEKMKHLPSKTETDFDDEYIRPTDKVIENIRGLITDCVDRFQRGIKLYATVNGAIMFIFETENGVVKGEMGEDTMSYFVKYKMGDTDISGYHSFEDVTPISLYNLKGNFRNIL